MSCILVGNGTSAIDAENGSRIDAFSNVVRFNQCDPQKYSKFVGVKTNTYFTVNPLKYFNQDRFQPLDKLYVYSWEKPETCKTWQSYTGILPATKVPQEVLDEMGVFMGNGYSHYSVGAAAAWLMLKEYETVTLTGFDWWDRKEHHYSDKADRGTIHEPQKEKDLFMRLAERGRLSFL